MGTGRNRRVFIENVAKSPAKHAFDFDNLVTGEAFGRKLIEDPTDLIACLD